MRDFGGSESGAGGGAFRSGFGRLSLKTNELQNAAIKIWNSVFSINYAGIVDGCGYARVASGSRVF